jgi:hypothetical protein
MTHKSKLLIALWFDPKRQFTRRTRGLIMTRRITWLAGALTLGLASCGTSPGLQTSGEYRSHASTAHLYDAALRAVPGVGYVVVSSSRSEGLITASQGAIQGPTAGLTAIITRQGAESVLNVIFQLPPGTSAVGDFDLNMVKFVDAVRTNVPDIHAER